MRGFPASPADRRELQLGTHDPATLQGGARLVMRCSGGRGYATIEITIRWEDESATFAFETDPATIDRWVRELDSLRNEVAAEVTLSATR